MSIPFIVLYAVLGAILLLGFMGETMRYFANISEYLEEKTGRRNWTIVIFSLGLAILIAALLSPVYFFLI